MFNNISSRERIMMLLGEINHPKYQFMPIEIQEKALSDDEWDLLIGWMATRIGIMPVSVF
jgi:hypothetical protein